MCGRFTLTVDNLSPLVAALGLTAPAELLGAYRPRYNVAPGETGWLVRSRGEARELLTASWGLVNSWAPERSAGFKQINARAESLAERPAFRKAYRSRRCLVLADGFYEWRGPRGRREPLWFHAPDRRPLFFAGLYETWTSPQTSERTRTFTIVTTAANATVRPVHDRMPVVVGTAELDLWLRGDRPEAVLRPAADDALVADLASPRVNRVGQDDPHLLDPDDPRGARQLSLF